MLGGGTPYQGDNPVTPGKTDITLAAHTLLIDSLTIKGDADLIADNIRKGIELFGVAGAMEEGVSGIDYGTIYFSSAPSELVTIPHSLGVVPSMAYVIKHSGTPTDSEIVVASLTSMTGGRPGYGSIYGYSKANYADFYKKMLTADSNQLTLSVQYNFLIPGASKYTWIAIA